MKKEEKVCVECGNLMNLSRGTYEDGIEYDYWKCSKCDNEILTMDQLKDLAVRERKAHAVKISKWGTAVAIRIPKSIAQTYNLVPGKEATIIPEKTGFKVVSRKK
jgi:DNA-directed RNA polymerase subunit RPC12/RpoP